MVLLAELFPLEKMARKSPEQGRGIELDVMGKVRLASTLPPSPWLLAIKALEHFLYVLGDPWCWHQTCILTYGK